MHLINADALRSQLLKQMESCGYEGNDQIYGILEKAIEHCEQFGIDSLNPMVHSLSDRQSSSFSNRRLPMTDACEHENFIAEVDVARLPESGRFSADVRIKCAGCGVAMRFIGLPAGLDLNGAAVSADATEARLAIAPQGEVASTLDGGSPLGFSSRRASP